MNIIKLYDILLFAGKGKLSERIGHKTKGPKPRASEAWLPVAVANEAKVVAEKPPLAFIGAFFIETGKNSLFLFL